MFGGGVEAGVVDPAMPIRVTAIRGRLRYWWRLLYAQGLGAAQLRRREAAIWGDTKQSSDAVVQVSLLQPGTRRPCAENPPGKYFRRIADISLSVRTRPRWITNSAIRPVQHNE